VIAKTANEPGTGFKEKAFGHGAFDGDNLYNHSSETRFDERVRFAAAARWKRLGADRSTAGWHKHCFDCC
jgi:hypothetical protein